MARTKVTNPTSAAVTLPAPYHAIIPPGQSRIVDGTKAAIIASFSAGSTPTGLQMETVSDLAVATVSPMTGADIPDGIIGGAEIATLANSVTATTAVVGQEVTVAVVDFADVATNSVDLTVPFKVEIIDVLAQKRGGAGGAAATLQAFNGTGGNAISNALDMNVADKTNVRASTIDDAFSTIDVGGTLRLTNTKGATNAAMMVVVRGIKRA